MFSWKPGTQYNLSNVGSCVISREPVTRWGVWQVGQLCAAVVRCDARVEAWTETCPRPIWRSESSISYCIRANYLEKLTAQRSSPFPSPRSRVLRCVDCLSLRGLGFCHLCMHAVAACLASGRLTVTQLQPLRRTSCCPQNHTTEVAELSGVNAVPTDQEQLRPLQSAGKLLMLMSVDVCDG